LLKDGELVHWERGIDRIADLEILEELSHHSHGSSALSSGNDLEINNEFNLKLQKLNSSHQKIKYIEFNDVWERFIIKFSIYLPNDDNGDQAYIEIISNQHSKNGLPTSIKMNRTPRQDGWLQNKYGKQVIPW
jgi:hypothetical protein